MMTSLEELEKLADAWLQKAGTFKPKSGEKPDAEGRYWRTLPGGYKIWYKAGDNMEANATEQGYDGIPDDKPLTARQAKVAESAKKHNVAFSNGKLSGDTYGFYNDNKSWIKKRFSWDGDTKHWRIKYDADQADIDKIMRRMVTAGKSNTEILGEDMKSLMMSNMSDTIKDTPMADLRAKYYNGVVTKLDRQYKKPANISDEAWISSLQEVVGEYVTNNPDLAKKMEADATEADAKATAEAEEKERIQNIDPKEAIQGAKVKIKEFFDKEVANGKYANPTRNAIGGLALDIKMGGFKPKLPDGYDWSDDVKQIAEELLFPSGKDIPEPESKPNESKWTSRAETKPYWVNDGGNWKVMGPKGLKEGDEITVYKKNGDTQKAQVYGGKDGEYYVTGPKEYVGKSCWECGANVRWQNSDRCVRCGEEP